MAARNSVHSARNPAERICSGGLSWPVGNWVPENSATLSIQRRAARGARCARRHGSAHGRLSLSAVPERRGGLRGQLELCPRCVRRPGRKRSGAKRLRWPALARSGSSGFACVCGVGGPTPVRGPLRYRQGDGAEPAGQTSLSGINVPSGGVAAHHCPSRPAPLCLPCRRGQHKWTQIAI